MGTPGVMALRVLALRVLLIMGMMVSAYAQSENGGTSARRRRNKQTEVKCQLTTESSTPADGSSKTTYNPCQAEYNCPSDCPKIKKTFSGDCCVDGTCTSQDNCDDASATGLIIGIFMCICCYGSIGAGIALCFYCANKKPEPHSAMQNGGVVNVAPQVPYAPQQGGSPFAQPNQPMNAPAPFMAAAAPPVYAQPQGGAGWTQHTDPNTGQTYESNAATGETRWVTPESAVTAASQWTQHTDPNTGQTYESNAANGETRWVAAK